jgi:hypothetical protein
MTNLIFTVHFDIDVRELDIDDIQKNTYTKTQLEKYKNNLTLNKFTYSKNINCDFICFDDEEDLREFSKNYKNVPLYTIINFYKLHLLDKLSEEYDNVLYLDQDVFINTSVNIFNHLTNNVYVWHENVKDQLIEYINFYKDRQLYSRSYLNKCISSLATSYTFDWPINYKKYNTGIILGSQQGIKKLKITENLNFVVANAGDIRYNKDIPKSFTSNFHLNNEAFFANIVAKEDVDISNIEQKWHHILNYENVEKDYKESNSYFYHFINKEFSWCFS